MSVMRHMDPVHLSLYDKICDITVADDQYYEMDDWETRLGLMFSNPVVYAFMDDKTGIILCSE